MDQTNQQKLSRFTKSQFLKKLTKLLLSISVFSLLFSSSSLLSFLQPWHFQLSTFPLRLVTHAVDKNCIFLLCNGILVFLAKNSGFIGSKTRSRRGTGNKEPAKETLYMMENKLLATDIDNGVFHDVAREDFSLEGEGKTLNGKNNNHEDCVVEVEAEDVCFHAEECTRDDDNDDVDEVEQEDSIHFSTLKAGTAVAISNSHGDEELDDCGGAREDETGEVYSDGNNAMTAEELDKKFDEFIRRMKEGIMIEAQQQQQLLMV
ncbi:uncharacterized protein LOC115748868 [Rhodamnia argentea]|uniref:Uncharacterized protein LOC115748868 n=1 Tax=Rhodamnia argentea TaxID=178133 RepID=A0A8B8Q2S7_9MYRT|nr:uncharacterized protein LOC115748868 [Rhodamnia argentea]